MMVLLGHFAGLARTVRGAVMVVTVLGGGFAGLTGFAGSANGIGSGDKPTKKPDEAAYEGCEAEYTFTDPLIVVEPKDHSVTEIWPKYIYDSDSTIWCGENSIVYGIMAYTEADKEPALFWRNFVTGDVQTVVSGRNFIGQIDPYDWAAEPVACSSRDVVFFKYRQFNTEGRIYYWTPGTAWDQETGKTRILPFRGEHVLPSPDGKRVVVFGNHDKKTQLIALQVERLGGSSGLEVIGLPAKYVAHAWLMDSAKLLVSRRDGNSKKPTRGIFDLRNPKEPFRPFDWPDHFQRLIGKLPSGYGSVKRDFVDDGGDSYALRFFRKGQDNTATPTSEVVMDRCRFATNRVACQPVGQPVELEIGYFWFTHPDAPILYYKTFDRSGILRRYDAVSGTDKAVAKGWITGPSPGGRFLRGWMADRLVHQIDACQ